MGGNRLTAVCALTCFWAQAVVGQTCPTLPDTSDQRAALHSELLHAPSEGAAQQTAGKLWDIWLTAPDAQAQGLLDRAMARREVYDFADAETILDQLVAYCPDYAEGFNQRAFVRFLRDNYEGALSDLDVVLARNPYHFGALSGKALSLMRVGRMKLAQDVLRAAVEVHPFLQERALLVKTPDDI